MEKRAGLASAAPKITGPLLVTKSDHNSDVYSDWKSSKGPRCAYS